MDRHEIKGHEVIKGEVKPTGNGAHALVLKQRGYNIGSLHWKTLDDFHSFTYVQSGFEFERHLEISRPNDSRHSGLASQ